LQLNLGGKALLSEKFFSTDLEIVGFFIFFFLWWGLQSVGFIYQTGIKSGLLLH
jgi:hypothetical protein